MKRLIAVCLTVTVTITGSLHGLCFAGLYGSSQSTGNPASAQLGQLAQASGALKSFQPDLFTGRAQTGIPIFVPPGRKGVQPSLSLSYSSSAGSGWLGVGWGLDAGSIQRDVKNGVPKYDASDKFVLSFQGISSELVSVAANEYRAKDEALFLKVVFDPANNRWTVTDKSGTKYFFGYNSNSRLAIPGKGTFKWCLFKVLDTSGNKMEHIYTSAGGELYLQRIEYNANETQGFAHTHKVVFTLEDRPDKSFSYISGGRIELNKRLKDIQVRVKDAQGVFQLARKYTLFYNISLSSSRSRLYQVREYGKDGATALPPMTFTYQDKVQQLNAMADFTGIVRAADASEYDYGRTVNISGDTLADISDMNGDGLADRVQAVAGNTAWQCQLNNGTGFGPMAPAGALLKPTSWQGYDFVTKRTDAGEQATELLDINGDGRPDRIIAQDGNSSWTVQINNGAGFVTPASAWGGVQRMVPGSTRYDYIRYSPTGYLYSQTLVDFFDVNGDGLPDRVQSAEGNTNWKVQLNTGSGFAGMIDFGPIENAAPSDPKRTAIRYIDEAGETVADVADINGDGLPDRVLSTDANTDWKIQFNTGTGFTSMQNFGPIVRLLPVVRNDHVRFTSTSGEAQVDLFDINGDGLPDRVQGSDSNTYWKIQYNTGTGFTGTLQDYGPVEYMSSSVRYSYPRWYDKSGQIALDVMDLDGDGLPDRCQSLAGNAAWKMQKNKGPYPDLLSTVDNGRGGRTTITYSSSTSFDNRDTEGKHRLPFSVQAVTQVAQEDGLGHTVLTQYSYKGGMYDAGERELRGFREVTVTDAGGTKTIHTFGQDSHNKGKLLQKEVWGCPGTVPGGDCPSDVLFSKEVTTWSDTHPWGESAGVHFVHVSQSDVYLYDGDETYKQMRRTFTYDGYGNLASVTEEGDLSVSGDERTTANEYVYAMAAPGTGNGTYIVNTLKKTTVYGADLTARKAEKYFYYDGASSIDTVPVKGLLTREIKWLDTCAAQVPDPCHPSVSMAYDDYGNLTAVTDARGYQTSNEYDPVYRLFLMKITNPLGHTREFTYDAWLAQILTSKDQNGQISSTEYDALGRVRKAYSPLDAAGEPAREILYDDSAVPNKTTVKTKTSKPGEPYSWLTVYSFTDGLGREIQKRSPAEDPARQIVTAVSFDGRGLTDKQWNPYFEDSSAAYQAPPAAGAKAAFSYDAVGRRTRVDYPDGTNSQAAFSDFIKTTTDPRGKQLRYTSDAYGRLAKVEEFNAGAIYSTVYEYDERNNLTRSVDNAGNQTTLVHDSLSRKTAMSDPDMGAWSYAYDTNDNLASQTDAKNQTISFVYDALNRVTLKDLPAGETDAVYTYDDPAAAFSRGRLTKVADASGTHEFWYDELGRVTLDRKTIDGTGYSFSRVYDALGRVRSLVYPDGEDVIYDYNGTGDVEAVHNSAGTVHYIGGVDYNAAGQITRITYGNGVTSDYAYDPQSFRLSNITTRDPGGVTKLQDLTYSFDPNGNVTHISDPVHSMSQDFTYDDLNRLVAAAGSAYGTQTFAYDSIGNMIQKGAREMSYGTGGTKPHAVTEIPGAGNGDAAAPSFCSQTSGPCTLSYDANGNMVRRGADQLSYDSENRLKQMKKFEAADGTHSFTLQPGWNLVSFTWLPEDRSVANVLSALGFGPDYDQVSYWDPAAGRWKHFVNDPEFNDFSEFEHGKSYEIYVTKAGGVSFQVPGKSPALDVAAQVREGDNFIGPAVKGPAPVSEVLAPLALGTDYSDVKRLNASTGQFESYAAGQFTAFEPGRGYILTGLRDASFSFGRTETVTDFVYDSSGARVKKISGNSASLYFGKDYDISQSPSGSLTPTGAAALATKYVFLGNRRIALKDSSGSLLFIHDDHIGSSNVVTDASGSPVALYEYDPYGSTVTQTGAAEVKHRFTGQESDDSTGLYYYGARYYDPQLGRFITADWMVGDPVNPQDLNRYAYARNNPVVYNDPSGNFAFMALAAAFLSFASQTAAVVGAVSASAAIIAGWAGNSHLASTFNKIAGIASIVSTGTSLGANMIGGGPSIDLPTSGSAEIPSRPEEESGGGFLSFLTGLRNVSEDIRTGLQVSNDVAKYIGPQFRGPKANVEQVQVFSRPAVAFGLYGFSFSGHHLFVKDNTSHIYELINKGTNSIVKRAPDDFGAEGVPAYLNKWRRSLQGPVSKMVEKQKFEMAFEKLKERYEGKPYDVGDNSNNFVIGLFEDSDNPLTEHELKLLKIEKRRGIWS